MRRTPLLLFCIAVAVALLPAPAWAAPCSETAPVLNFNANPKTGVGLGSETRFTFKFHFSAPCEGGTTLRSETHDISGGVDRTVRARDWNLAAHPELRDDVEDNWDFNATWITTPGSHLFNGRVFLDGRQISASAPVTVTAAGTVTGGPTTSGGESGPPQAGPVPLEVRIGDFASAVDIPSYVAALYRYGLGVGTTIAMVMVVIGGFQYVASRGNPAAIGAAKSRIMNAVLGLLLLLGSFTLLQTINPDLVSMRNIVVSEIRRVETISNKCEDFDREAFVVTPTTGRCGERGTVGRRDSTQLATNTCTWGVCGAEGEVCVVRGSQGPGCVTCGQVIDDQLELWGLSQNTASCRRFRRPNVGTSVNDCVFSNDDRLNAVDDFCLHAYASCAQVHSCGDYDSQARGEAQGRTNLNLESLIDYSAGGTWWEPSPAFRNFCNADPCHVGPCHAVQGPDVSALSTFLELHEARGDLWNCMEGAQ